MCPHGGLASPSMAQGPRNRVQRLARVETSFIWHSHTTNTFQPRFRSRYRVFRSRTVFALNLVAQNSALVAGIDCPLRHRCRCQKHPWTKITFRRDGNTMSGLPGRSARWRRYRYPRACSSRRTRSSGAVSRPLILDIRRLRPVGVSWSIIHSMIQASDRGQFVGMNRCQSQETRNQYPA